MNKVYISGKLVEQPILRMEGKNPHLTLTLRVAHKTRAGERKTEDYPVNAWNRAAQWGMANLERGQVVALQGYLTQNAQSGGATEVTVEEFLPLRVVSVPTMDAEPIAHAAAEVSPCERAAV